jgi:hypothetical protein
MKTFSYISKQFPFRIDCIKAISYEDAQQILDIQGFQVIKLWERQEGEEPLDKGEWRCKIFGTQSAQDHANRLKFLRPPQKI